ncbi:MAG: hypothetical protein HQK51_17815, partial [Oligoflexia bacterium]|nr:hypothetical protein [Oligoflexia bacterium]
ANMKSIKVIFVILGMLLLVSCQVSVGPGPITYPTVAEDFVQKLNYYYGNTYGQSFSLVKENGYEAPSYCVLYDQLTGEYSAFNLANFGYGTTMDSYLSTAAPSDVINFLDPQSNGLYYSWDYDIYFEQTEGNSKDLEKVGAFLEEKKAYEMGGKLSAEFGLSEERGVQIAKLAGQWSALKKKRSLTDADAQAFSQKLIGVDLSTAISAFQKSQEGNNNELNAMLEKAAVINGTTPERMNKIFNEVITK